MKMFIVALSTLASTSAAQTFRVAGTVIDSETAVPLGRTRVVLTGGPVPEQSAITAAAGTFSFAVPQGKYTLLAAYRDFGESYGQARSGRSSSAIVVGPEQDTTRIVMHWHAPVAIHGKVLDDEGEPVHEATVELFVEAVTNGRKHVISLGRAESDELGDYSWSSIPAGTYYLAATGQPWYFSDPNARQALAASGRSVVPYALTYFPGTDDSRAATPLILRPGDQLQADITLRPASGSNLRFVCANTPCGGSVSLFAIGPGEAETLVRTADMADCYIPAVAPGRYIVHYIASDSQMWKQLEVVGGDNVIEIKPKPFPTLSGRVAFQQPSDRPRQPVYVNLRDEDTRESVAAALDVNGNFSWPTVPVSRVRLSVSGSDGFFISRMSVDGALVKDGVIDIVDGAKVRVNLTASRQVGGVNGVVLNGNKPEAGVMVVLALAAGSTDPNSYHALQTNSDGSFDFAAVPVGDYVLFAVDNLEFQYADFETVQPYLSSGKRVRVEPHSVEAESIRLTPATLK